MEKKRGLYFLSVAAICVSLALIVGATYALYTDSATINNHLQSGSLNLTLKRTYLIQKSLNQSGYIEAKNDDSIVDFSAPTSQNVFGVTSETLIAPCSSLAATMEITNHSDVAFIWWLEIKFDSIHSGQALAKQLLVTVTTYDENDAPIETCFMLKELLKDDHMIGSAMSPIGESAVNSAAQKFIVKVDFINNSLINNFAQDQTAYFDLVVYAVQKVSQN